MNRFDSPQAAREWCRAESQSGRSLGFVPTMGALHAGHLGLVRRAVAENDVACVSIFVNPLQFGDREDFENYPRHFERDAELLESAGCAMVFRGTPADFFPEGDDLLREDPGPAALGLEGEHRPGHFEGVATVVKRLFEFVQPSHAYFGEKDFQQLLVIRDLAARMKGPAIVGCPIHREASGLASSSRNERLSPAERERATCISAGLFAARECWQSGERNAERLLRELRKRASNGVVELEYAELRDPLNWSGGPLTGTLERAQALVAATLGKVRLIDNLRLDETPS